MNGSSPTLDISWGTIVKLAISALLLYTIFLVRDILIWVLFGLIISILLDPAIDALQRIRIPRVVGVIVVYLTVFGIIAFIFYGTAPVFVNEITRFSQFFPRYFETLSPVLTGLGVTAFRDFETFISSISGNIETISQNIFKVLFALFGGIFSTLFILSIAIFFSVEEKSVERGIALLFPRKYEVFALNLWAQSHRKVSAWFLSRLISSIFVAVATSISLFLFDVSYPFSLGLLAGILNFIPFVGPLIAGALIAMIVALDSLSKAIFVVLAFILIQQIESNILTPILTRRFIDMPSTLVLIALAVGAELWGIMGAILAIPLFGILYEFIHDFLKKRKEEQSIVL